MSGPLGRQEQPCDLLLEIATFAVDKSDDDGVSERRPTILGQS